MKSTLLLLVLMTVVAGTARADALKQFFTAMNGTITNPAPVTFDPKTIKPGDTVASIQKAFTDSQVQSETVDPITGNKTVVLRNVSMGHDTGGTSRKPKDINQTTTLTLVVDKNGKIASYDMTQWLMMGTSVTSRDMGSACFSDCAHSAKSIADAKKMSNPPSSIASLTSQDTQKRQSGNPQQDVKVSASTP